MKKSLGEVWKNPMDAAVKRLARAYGNESDQELASYNKMSQQDFAEMASEKGLDHTSKYIKKMELRRAESK